MNISDAAEKVLRIDLADSLIPRLRELVDEVAKDVVHEDSPNKTDLFLKDYVSQVIILELAQFLAQGEITEEDWAPVLRPHQLAPEYAKQWWDVEK